MRIINKISTCVVCLASLMLSMTSCSEKEEAGEYDNWEVRNIHYVDSIAKVCDSNADGRWTKFCAFNLNDSVEALSPNNLHYVYVHKLEDGTGDYSPLYKDSIRVHYLGRLIPSVSYPQGYIFGKSYGTYTFNEATDVPALMAVNDNIVGFATAVMNMVEGDNWRLYIPYYIGYGATTNSSSSIPAYSTLIFDVKLARVYKYKIDTDTSWH